MPKLTRLMNINNKKTYSNIGSIGLSTQGNWKRFPCWDRPTVTTGSLTGSYVVEMCSMVVASIHFRGPSARRYLEIDDWLAVLEAKDYEPIDCIEEGAISAFQKLSAVLLIGKTSDHRYNAAVLKSSD